MSENRFEDVSIDVVNFFNDVRRKYFPQLVNAKFKLVFDLKKRTSGGKLVLARIQKTNDLLRHLTRDEAQDDSGYDYIVYIDKVYWENTPEIDRERGMRHEMRHCEVDIENEQPYQLKEHDIEDFDDEIKLNQDDTKWRERVAMLIEDIYAQKKEMEKEAKSS